MSDLHEAYQEMIAAKADESHKLDMAICAMNGIDFKQGIPENAGLIKRHRTEYDSIGAGQIVRNLGDI